MKMKTATAIIILMLCAVLLPAIVSAHNGKSCDFQRVARIHFYSTMSSIDTLPPSVKPVEPPGATGTIERPATAVIKQVPKARKVTVPRPLTVKVNPVKVVKPRIIKPVLKVL